MKITRKKQLEKKAQEKFLQIIWKDCEVRDVSKDVKKFKVEDWLNKKDKKEYKELL